MLCTYVSILEQTSYFISHGDSITNLFEKFRLKQQINNSPYITLEVIEYNILLQIYKNIVAF